MRMLAVALSNATCEASRIAAAILLACLAAATHLFLPGFAFGQELETGSSSTSDLRLELVSDRLCVNAMELGDVLDSTSSPLRTDLEFRMMLRYDTKVYIVVIIKDYMLCYRVDFAG